MFEAGLLLFAATAVLSALAPNVWVLIAARVLQAIGGALVIPSSLSMVLPMFPEHRRSTAVTSWAAAGPISAAIAPSTSAAILQISDWRWLFALSAPLGFGIWLLGRRRLREAPMTPPDTRLDAVGSVLGTAAIGLVVFGVGKGSDWGWSSATILGCFVAAGLSGLGFLRQSLRHPAPLLDLDLFRIRQVWMTNLANTLVSVTSLAIWLVWPLFLQRIWGYSSLEVGLALTSGPVAAATTSLAGGRIADRIGHRLPIIAGALVMVVAVGWCWLVLAPDRSFLVGFFPGITLFGFGWGLSSPAMNSFALDAVPESQWGSMNAAFNMLRNVAGAIGIAAGVAIVGSRERADIAAAFDRAFLFFFVFNAAAALVVLVAYPREGLR